MPPTDPLSPAAPEFVFGPLSTEEGRVRRARTVRAGLQHAAISPVDPRPGEDITVSVRAGLGIAVTAATLRYTIDGSFPEHDGHSTAHVVMERSSREWDTLTWSYLDTWEAVIPGQPSGTQVRYTVVATTAAGETIACPWVDMTAQELSARPESFDQRYLHRLARGHPPLAYGLTVDELTIPGWLRTAVIYQIFVDRFAPDPGRSFADEADLSAILGGTLRGIVSRLGYLRELGVTCLWLTPIFPAPSHHGYDPTDYRSIEPRLGTEDDFRELIDAAHDAGMRIVLDLVANHVSRLHPAFLAAQADPASPYREWFFFRDHPHHYESYYDVPDQPIVDTDHPAARDYLIGAATHWLGMGCDGFRLDHAHGATHAFWSAFRTATRAAGPDTVMLGEITDTPDRMRSFAGRMDGVLDFHLVELLRRFFAFGSITASRFDRVLRQHLAYFGDDLVLPSFLDNHDMDRFLWSVDGDVRRLRLAALCQFTLPQPPIVYYGTEVGLSQRRALGRLEEARLPMPWDDRQDRELLGFYRDLIALRKRTMAAWSLPRETVIVDDARSLLAYRCGDLTVILNNGPRAAGVEHPSSELVFATGPDVELRAGVLRLPPYSGAVCGMRQDGAGPR
jgi:cyclomaltodextrinase / maltogenic alpha-amylase / neopullulanase